MHFTGLLLVLSVAAQSPKAPAPGSLSAPPQAEPSPTAWSCTVETLSSGKDCIFESKARKSTDQDPSAQEAANVRTVRELAPQVCGRAARSGGKADKVLVDMCQRQFSAAAETCGLSGELPLLDEKGRFAPAARACYVALSEVLQKASFAASIATQCCQCLAASCKTPAERCYRDLVKGTPDKSARACLADTCAQECSGVGVDEEASSFRPAPASLPATASHGKHEL